MEFHDLAWWEEQLGLDKAGRAQLEEDLQTAKKKFPKPDELHTEKQIKDEYAKLLKEKSKAWKKIFDTLGVDDSLDGLARMESFIGGVFSSELDPELEGCLYAGGMSVGGYSGFMWKSDGLLRGAWVYLVDRGGNGQRGEQGAYRGQSLLLPTLTRSSASAEAEVLPLPFTSAFRRRSRGCRRCTSGGIARR